MGLANAPRLRQFSMTSFDCHLSTRWGKINPMKFSRIPNLPFWALMLLSLLTGLATLNHYGASWDEHLQYKQYARHAVDAYRVWFQEGRAEGQWEGLDEASGIVKDFHGPSFVMSVELFTRLALRLNPGWQVTDLRHLAHFLAFLAGATSLYFLARRWLGAWASFGAALLFVTQPVFWGHAFINPKDMPFAAFFLLSLLLGLRACDYLYASRPDGTSRWGQAAAAWDALPPRLRRTLLVAAVTWAVSILGLFAGVDIIRAALAGLVKTAYVRPDALAGQLLASVAEDMGAVPAEVYARKLFLVFLRLRGAYTLLSTAALLWLYRVRFLAGLRLLGWPVLLAGFVLGYTASIRIAGPLAGLLVGLLMLGRADRRAWPGILLYGLLGVTAMYCTWPYLWGGPVERLLEGLRVMSAFPWRGKVLFDGVYYAADQIPRSYLPTLLAIQLTEPVWFLAAAGLTAAGLGWRKNRKYSGLLFLALGWFVLPLAGFIFSRASLYDNFRQVLFILPPVFLLAGAALEGLFTRLHRPGWRTALIALLVLPGALAAVRLHPYQYVYYNSFAGETFRRYEADYWTTSFREAARRLGEIAEPNASVLVFGPGHTFEPFARPDLKFVDADPDYVVISTRYNWDLENYPEAREVARIERDGMVLAVIRQVPP